MSESTANVSASASGNIQIVEVDPAGKFIQIRNMSDKVRMMRDLERLGAVLYCVGSNYSFTLSCRLI